MQVELLKRWLIEQVWQYSKTMLDVTAIYLYGTITLTYLCKNIDIVSKAFNII